MSASGEFRSLGVETSAVAKSLREYLEGRIKSQIAMATEQACEALSARGMLPEGTTLFSALAMEIASRISLDNDTDARLRILNSLWEVVSMCEIARQQK